MYPWRATSRREMKVYQPGWDPSEESYANTTIDLSHAATAQLRPDRDGRAARRPAAPRPHDRRQRVGQGRAPGARATATSRAARSSSCSPTAASRATSSLEINTRKAGTREAREADLLEALAFSKLHFVACRGAHEHCPRDGPRPSRGRRPGAPDTRAEILAAARSLFADTRLRQYVGPGDRRRAGVDPALVHHYFGTKDDLFVAALEIPVDPRELLARSSTRARTAPRSGCSGSSSASGTTRTHRLPLLGLVRASLEPAGERLLREGFFPVVLGPVGERLGIDEPGAADARWSPAR